MAAREPGDERCKDCPEPHEPGRVRCTDCAELHRLAAAESRARRLKAKRCVVCGKPAAKRADGNGTATVCREHARYYAARAAAARAVR